MIFCSCQSRYRLVHSQSRYEDIFIRCEVATDIKKRRIRSPGIDLPLTESRSSVDITTVGGGGGGVADLSQKSSAPTRSSATRSRTTRSRRRFCARRSRPQINGPGCRSRSGQRPRARSAAAETVRLCSRSGYLSSPYCGAFCANSKPARGNDDRGFDAAGSGPLAARTDRDCDQRRMCS